MEISTLLVLKFFVPFFLHLDFEVRIIESLFFSESGTYPPNLFNILRIYCIPRIAA